MPGLEYICRQVFTDKLRYLDVEHMHQDTEACKTSLHNPEGDYKNKYSKYMMSEFQ